MDNQHRKIKGYGELSQEDIDLMNRLSALGDQIEEVLSVVNEQIKQHQHYIQQAAEDVRMARGPAAKKVAQDKHDYLLARMTRAEPQRWLAMGKTSLQQGLMFAKRAVARPDLF